MLQPTRLISTPFAQEGEKTEIQNVTGEFNNSATYQLGFPPLTMQSIRLGGKPPKGTDFNGILFDITENISFLCKGGRYQYNAGLSTLIGGYPEGSNLLLNDNVTEVVSTVAGNQNNPNTDMTGWILKPNKTTAVNVTDASGETQQQVNYNGGPKWHSRVGGYRENERVVLTNGDIVKSTIDVNANDPNVDMTGWVKTNAASQIFDESGEAQQTINDFNSGRITELLEKAKNTNKQRINISNFGSTGTTTVGSNDAWNSALAYAKSIAPKITNNIGQSWFDLSGFSFVADAPIYPSNPIALRSIYGLSINFNIILPDNFISTSAFAIDTSIRTSADNSLNRRPLNISMHGNINCRYKGNGIYLNDFLHFTLYGNIYNFFSKGVETGANGNEFIQMPQSTIGQWQYTAGNEANLPSYIITGTAIDINCGDCIILGITSYYYTRGIRVNGRSAFIGAGAHIYGDRKQALLQTTGGGNLLLDGAWFDAARVHLVAEAQMRNCRVHLSSADSLIGVNIYGGVEVSVEGNVFLGTSSGTTAVYRDDAALAEKTCVVHNNRYWDGISNSDIRNLAPTVRGNTIVGTTTYTQQTGVYTHSGNKVDFTMRVAWSASDASGNLVIPGLPLAASQNAVFSVMDASGSMQPIVAYILAGFPQILLRGAEGPIQVTAKGDLYISGSYFI